MFERAEFLAAALTRDLERCTALERETMAILAELTALSCASADLQCTGRNHPSRISCAIPRASLRSVFTGIADNAAFTCRVSNSSTASPASRSAA